MIDAGFCREGHKKLYRLVPSVDAVFDALAMAPGTDRRAAVEMALAGTVGAGFAGAAPVL